jgi:septal ring factor EnvC (AmiA/AmiB activator)
VIPILAIAILASGGCERSMDAQPDKHSDARSTTGPTPAIEPPAAVGTNDAAQREQQAKARGVEDLQVELAALQSQHDALQIERDQLSGQIESHQAEGEKKLATLRAQWSALEDKPASAPGEAAARERFAESARVEMESALMMDQEYRAHLEETEGKLRETKQMLRALREQQASAAKPSQ